MRFKRMLCWWLGCCDHNGWCHGPECNRCGLDIYDPSFIDKGVYWRIRAVVVRAVCRVAGFRCCQCGRIFWKSRGGLDEYTCSKECDSQWIPF